MANKKVKKTRKANGIPEPVSIVGLINKKESKTNKKGMCNSYLESLL